MCMLPKLISFKSTSFFTLELEIAAVVTGCSIPKDGTSIAQQVLHFVQIKTQYLLWFDPQVVITLYSGRTISATEIPFGVSRFFLCIPMLNNF